MTEIAIRNEQTAVAAYSGSSMDRLEQWARQAAAVHQVAEQICSTSFAPAAYRGKPAEATAAILAGAELGFDPMASLRAFDNIQGVPAPKAITLRAVVQGAGHEIETVESSATRAVVRGRRHGQGEWQTSVWDIPRAQLMPQYKSNPNYRTNPAAMLVARATAEVCRWIASDAIMGMPYAAEEIADQPPVAAAPVARRLTVADLDTAPAQADEEMDDDQRDTMFTLWADLGYDIDSDADRATLVTVTAKILGLPELQSSSDLTRGQADQVIAALIKRGNQQQAGEGQ
jgi:hypothetical protein